MLKEKLPAIGRALSLLLLVATIAVVVTAFIRARRRPVPPGPIKAEAKLKANVTSRVEGYERVMLDDHGHEKYRLRAAVDTAYDDGRHEMEKVDLTALGEIQKDGKQKSVRITSELGAYTPDQSLFTFETHVIVTSSEGLEVTTEKLNYDQKAEMANTDVAVQFKHGEISGSSIGAQLYAKEHLLNLAKDAHIVATPPEQKAPKDPKKKTGQPIEMRSEKASYAEAQGVARFEGNATITQGEKFARADLITGIVNPLTKKLDRVEMRGNSYLKSQEKTKTSELQARDLDFYFDEVQHLKQAVATGSARATSLEKDSPREITAEKIEAFYTPGEKESLLQSIVTQGRTTMKIEIAEGAPNAKEMSERIIEADAVNAAFREDGVNLANAEATGNAVLTITPKTVKPKSDRQRLTAAKFTADFFQKGNAIKTFLADGNAVAEFTPLEQKTKRSRRTVTGKKLTANLIEQTQDIDDLTVEGGAKFVETPAQTSKASERNATADRAIYTASNQTVAMRGKPQLCDSSSRANADEIDANVETS
ncbi:MAG: LPS export ABC transporter periplasmic protein LptC, partial [Acidobacteriota bacterium]